MTARGKSLRGAALALALVLSVLTSSGQYPEIISLNVALGTRLRIAGPLSLNPSVAYVSGISSLSLRAGLGFIL